MIDWPSLILKADLTRSFMDFHAPGVNYACLEFTRTRVIKLYELPDSQGEFIVAPHDHSYEFMQTVLAGRLRNYRFKSSPGDSAKLYTAACYYDTPLNGGHGRFQCDHFTHLSQIETHFVSPGGCYMMSTDEIHTIATDGPTWVVTMQAQDTSPHPFTYFKRNEIPDVNPALYKPMNGCDLTDMADRLHDILRNTPKA